VLCLVGQADSGKKSLFYPILRLIHHSNVATVTNIGKWATREILAWRFFHGGFMYTTHTLWKIVLPRKCVNVKINTPNT